MQRKWFLLHVVLKSIWLIYPQIFHKNYVSVVFSPMSPLKWYFVYGSFTFFFFPIVLAVRLVPLIHEVILWICKSSLKYILIWFWEHQSIAGEKIARQSGDECEPILILSLSLTLSNAFGLYWVDKNQVGFYFSKSLSLPCCSRCCLMFMFSVMYFFFLPFLQKHYSTHTHTASLGVTKITWFMDS